MLIHNENALARAWRELREQNRRRESRAFRRAHRRGHARLGAILVPDVGEVNLLDKMLEESDEDTTLSLYRTDVTPAEADTLGTFTVANFTNFTAKTLVAATWAAASTSGGTTSKAYAQQSWTCGASGNTIYGALYIDADTTTLMASDDFATARVLADTDVLNFTPRWELA